MHGFAPLMDTVAACGAPGPLYGGVFTIEGYSEGYFLPTWMTAFSFVCFVGNRRLYFLIQLHRM
jgi:hypothetical protein